jgi:ankyrin repeat protein
MRTTLGAGHPMMEPMKRSPLNELLLNAIERNEAASVAHCLKAGADPNCDVHSDGGVILTHAIEKSFTQAAILLLEHGALCCAKTDSHKVPLATAARYANPVVVAKLLEAGAKVDEVTLIDRSTPLQLAASDGETEVCQLLIEAGANVRTSANSGWTPLHHAARALGDSVGTCRTLVSAGADMHSLSVPHPHALSQHRYSPIEEALMAGRLNVVQFFLDECGALADRPIEAVEALLDLASAPYVREYLRSVISSRRVEQSLEGSDDAPLEMARARAPCPL